MVRVFERDAGTVWVTPRDEQVMVWFTIVRVANVQSVRWVLGALNGDDCPVSVRRAQVWCARMERVGMVERAQLGGSGGSLVWGTHAGTGLSRPDLYRQTTRHEVAVAIASARYAAAGYAWRRDEKPAYAGGHQADGVAFTTTRTELVEVELTGKRMPRYSHIFRALRRRIDGGEADTITYLCNPESGRAVRTALQSIPAGRSIVDRVHVHEVYDRAGQWLDDRLPTWMTPASDHAV